MSKIVNNDDLESKEGELSSVGFSWREIFYASAKADTTFLVKKGSQGDKKAIRFLHVFAKYIIGCGD